MQFTAVSIFTALSKPDSLPQFTSKFASFSCRTDSIIDSTSEGSTARIWPNYLAINTQPDDRRQMELNRDNSESDAKLERKWNQLPGKNHYYCDGRVIMSRQAGVFYCTVALLVGTFSLFAVFDAPFLWHEVNPAVPLFASAVFLISLGQLFKTSFSDPGVVPRATDAERAYVEQQIIAQMPPADRSTVAQYRPPPRTKEVVINGQTIKLKYCFTCHIFRPPRCSHCSVCDNCILNFDHHCPWVGNCVGGRNYRHFYYFITSISLLTVFIFAADVLHLVLLSKTNNSFLKAMQQSPSSLIVILICFFSVWSVLGLSVYHTYLMSTGQTTNEDLKGTFNPKRQGNSKNPFVRGGMIRTCLRAMCKPEKPSVLDRRGIVREPIICVPSTNSVASSMYHPAILPACTIDRTNSDTELGLDDPESGPSRIRHSPDVAIEHQQNVTTTASIENIPDDPTQNPLPPNRLPPI